MARDIGAVVPAAGEGARLGAASAKAFVELGGLPLICHTMRALHACSRIGWIVVVARREDQARMTRLLRRHRFTKVSAIIPGGPSRAESVAHGIAALPTSTQWVLVHDGARPCVRPQLLTAAIRGAQRHGAVACGLPAPLTVKTVDTDRSVRLTLDRDTLWFIQTPQVFRRDWWVEALVRLDHQPMRFPDDVSMLEWAGFPVRVIPGEASNVKITTPEDLVWAEAMLVHRRNGRRPARR